MEFNCPPQTPDADIHKSSAFLITELLEPQIDENHIITAQLWGYFIPSLGLILTNRVKDKQKNTLFRLWAGADSKLFPTLFMQRSVHTRDTLKFIYEII